MRAGFAKIRDAAVTADQPRREGWRQRAVLRVRAGEIVDEFCEFDGVGSVFGDGESVDGGLSIRTAGEDGSVLELLVVSRVLDVVVFIRSARSS